MVSFNTPLDEGRGEHPRHHKSVIPQSETVPVLDGGIEIPERFREFLLGAERLEFRVNDRGEVVLAPVASAESMQGALTDAGQTTKTSPTADLRTERDRDKEHLDEIGKRYAGEHDS